MSGNGKYPKPDELDKASGVRDIDAENEAFDKDFQEWLNRESNTPDTQTPIEPPSENSSNGESSNSDSSGNDSENDSSDNGGSNSPTKSCEVCDPEAINCLCDVKINPANSNDVLYHWKGGSVIRKPKNLKFLIGQDPFTVNYEVIGECDHETKPCSKLFYYQKTGPKAHKGYEEKGQSGNLVLRYDPEVKKELKNEKSTKMMCFLNKDGTDIMFDEGMMLVEWMKCSFLFFALSKFHGIPLTAYQLIVPECDTGTIANEPTAHSNEIKRKAEIKALVLPKYAVDVGININMGKNLGTQKKRIVGKSANETPSLGFEVEIKYLKEKLDGSEINSEKDLSLNLTGFSALAEVPAFNVLSKFDQFLSKVKLDGLKPSPALPIMFTVTPPNVAITGKAELEVDDSGGLSIKRSGELDMDPLLGMGLTFDALDAFLTLFPPAKVLAAGKKMLKVGNFRGSSYDQILKVKGRVAAAGKKKNAIAKSWEKLTDNFVFSAYARCDISFSILLAGKVSFLSSKVLEEPKQSLISGGKAVAEIKATLELEVEIRVFEFQAVFAAKLEISAAWNVYYVKTFDGTESKAEKGCIEDGNGDSYEHVIESTGVRVKWSVTFKLTYKDEDIFDISAGSETSDSLTREEWMRMNGFDIDPKTGEAIDDEAYYDTKYPYLKVRGGSGYDPSGASQMINAGITRRKEQRERFRELDQGEQVLSRSEVVYPPHRAGRATLA